MMVATASAQQNTTIQLPTWNVNTVGTTVTVPDGGTGLLGGINRASEGSVSRGVPLLNKIPPDQRFSSEKLVDDLRNRGKDAHFFPDTDAILDFLTREARSGDLVLIMSNGGFDNIHQRLIVRL